MEDSVDRIRRTNNDITPKKVAQVLGNEAEVTGRYHEVKQPIRNLEEITTAKEVETTSLNGASNDFKVAKNCIRAMQSAYKVT